MKLVEKDIITLDGVEYEVISCVPGKSYVFQEHGKTNYFYTSFKTQSEVDELAKQGKLVLGKALPKSSSTCFWHNWQEYVGIIDVYKYCTNCGQKEPADWRKIKSDKEYF